MFKLIFLLLIFSCSNVSIKRERAYSKYYSSKESMVENSKRAGMADTAFIVKEIEKGYYEVELWWYK